MGIGVEPGLSDVFARHAADELFGAIEEAGVRDGADLVVEGYDFAPTFSIWTTIEECLNPPADLGARAGLLHDSPFSEPEVFEFPEGIGAVECVNVEHEEVVLIPRWVACERVTFKYGLGQEFIDVLATLHKLGLDSTEPVSVGAPGWPPRCRRRHAAGPGDARRADDADGRARAPGCGAPARTGSRARPTSTTSWTTSTTMREYGTQAVVWQTAINPVVALELLDRGDWKGVGVLGPEAFPPAPFLALLGEYGAPHGQVEVPIQV